MGYIYRGLATLSEEFRAQAARVNATFDPSQPRVKFFPSNEAIYEVLQTHPSDCEVLVGWPADLRRLMIAMDRDHRPHVLNELIDSTELRDTWAQKQGHRDFAEYETAREMKVNPQQYKSLVAFQVRDRVALDAIVAEIRSTRYGNGNSIGEVLTYLKDRAEAKSQPNATALSVRTSRERAQAIAAQDRAVAEAQRQQQIAREFPYIAVLTCGLPDHINIIACFSGSQGVDTEIKLTNGSSVQIYKVYNLMEAGQERKDGFYIDLRRNFSIRVQNADDTLILGLKIIDRITGRILREDKAAKFRVISASE